MKRLAVGAALLGALGASCGEPSDSANCGPGTMEVNGLCQIADGSGGDSSLGGSGGSDSTASGTNTGADSGGTASDSGGSGGSGGANGAGAASANGSGGSAPTGSGGSGGDTTGSGGTATGGTAGDGAGGNGTGGGAGDGTGGGNTVGAGGSTSGAGGTGGGDPISTEPFECGSRDVSGATKVEGSIVADTTWSGLIHVIGDVSVRNEATLTIEPGTKIIVGLDHTIDFGWENSHPTLLAEGTPEAPIVFCGETDTPGYWETLSIQAGVNPDSVLRNVLIQEAGASNAAFVVNAPVLLEGVQVVDSGTVGVEASSFSPDSRLLSVHNSGDYAGRATSQHGVDWPNNLDFTGNAYDRIHLGFTELSESVYFEAKGAGFVQDGPLLPANGGDGLTIRVGPGIAYDNSAWGMELQGATLLVEGTEADPVIFAGAVTASAGVIQHATISRTGQLGAMLILYGPVSLQNVNFDSLHFVDEGSFAPDSYGLRGVESKPSIEFATSSCAAVNTLPLDTEMPAEGRIDLSCALDAEPVSLPNVGGEYDLGGARSIGSGQSLTIGTDVVVSVGGCSVESDGTLTIEAGARLRLTYSLFVWGTFSAQGEPDAPVVFEPNSNAWSGFTVYEGASMTLDHAVVDGVAQGERPPESAAALVLHAPASITNTTISNSEVWGLLHTEDDTTDYSVSNTFVDNTLGDVGTFVAE